MNMTFSVGQDGQPYHQQCHRELHHPSESVLLLLLHTAAVEGLAWTCVCCQDLSALDLIA